MFRVTRGDRHCLIGNVRRPLTRPRFPAVSRELAKAHSPFFCAFSCCQVQHYIVQTSQSEHCGAPGLSGCQSPQLETTSQPSLAAVSVAHGASVEEKKKSPPSPSHTSTALLELRCKAHTVCTHPVKDQAINKEHAIYEHFLSAALWKHITWRRDPPDPVLSQHPEHETTLADLQG